MWNQSINLLNSQFIPLIMSSIINFYDMRFQGEENVSKISAYCSILAITLILGSLIAIFIKIAQL